MQGIVFAIFSYFSWGIGDIFGTMASRKMGSLSLTFWVLIAGLVIFSLYIPFAWHDLQAMTPALLGASLMLGIMFVLGELLFNQATRVGHASLVITIVSSFSAVTVVLSVFFLHESISRYQIVAIMLIFIGLVLSTLNLAELRAKKWMVDRGVIMALFAMVLWGSYFTLIKPLILKIGWFWPDYIAFSLFPLIFLYMKVCRIKLEKPTKNNVLWLILISVLLLRGGDFSINYAVSHSLVAVVTPIAGSYATLSALLAFFVFKDPIRPQQIVGIVVTLIGIIFLSVVSQRDFCKTIFHPQGGKVYVMKDDLVMWSHANYRNYPAPQKHG